MSKELRLLFVGCQVDAELALAELERAGFVPFLERVETAEELAVALAQGQTDAILADDALAGLDLRSRLRVLQDAGLDLPFIAICGHGNFEQAIEVMRAGASDCVLKSNLARLGPAVERALFDAANRHWRRAREATQRNLKTNFEGGLERPELQIERLPLAYVMVDDQLRVLEWNPAAEKTFGYTKNEILGQVGPDVLLPSGLAGPHREILHRLRGGDMDANIVHENRTKDGRTITCQWYNTPLLDSEGRFVGIICLGQDITEQKALEERLRQAQKLEALGQLAAGIAHDFSGFATAINVCTYLLTELLRSDAKALRLLHEINKVVERLTSLARELLAFSRQQVMVPRIICLNDVVRDAEEMLRRILPANIQLSATLDPRADRVKADPEQLQRVMFNLVVNARDAMPEGGTLTIETYQRTLEESDRPNDVGLSPGRYAVLAVSDSGVGISREVKQRIFEPFFTTKESGGVSGLGLAVVHGIIKQSGGYVAVESEPGRGARFTIYLPSAEQFTALD